MPEKAIAAGLALAVLASPIAYGAKIDPNNAKAILEQVEKNISSEDEVATMKMTITEADGTPKDRTMEIYRKGSEGTQKVLVRIQGPADLKGTGLLSIGQDQWLYLPSSKQTRRLQAGNKKSGFMDSELSYEDMGANSDGRFDSKVIKQEELQGHKFAVIENKPKGESSYGKILVWVDLDKYLVGKMEYYDKSMKLLKESVFSGYKQFDKGVWRARKVEVRNLQNKRGTTVELSNLKLNKGIDDEEFTESALTDE